MTGKIFSPYPPPLPPKKQPASPPPPSRNISIREALHVARRACATVLFGEPAAETFDKDDLAQTAALLGNLSITPIFPEIDLTGPGNPDLAWSTVFRLGAEVVSYTLSNNTLALSRLPVGDLTEAARRLWQVYLSELANEARLP